VLFQGYIRALISKTELNLLKRPSAQFIAQIRIRMAFLATNSSKELGRDSKRKPQEYTSNTTWDYR